MATAYLKTPTFRAPPALFSSPQTQNSHPLISLKRKIPNICSKINFANSYSKPSNRRFNLSIFASNEETIEIDEKVETEESEIQDNIDSETISEETLSEDENEDSKEPISIITSSLKSYKEALSNNNESKASEIEAFLIKIEEEKANLEKKVATLSEELSYERDRVLRISADFDNFRKRTERERLSLVTNAKGEVVESLLPVLDNFERAKASLKIGNEGEEKVNSSYQSIYKQFVEILDSIGVVPVEPIGTPFDPLLHEAIMREESTEYEDGIVIEEYRKGFKLGDRLLRPSMVKVSAGPGPAKPDTPAPAQEPASEGNDDVAVTGGSKDE